MNKTACQFILIALGLILLNSPGTAAGDYFFTTIDFPGAENTEVYGLNNSDVLVGIRFGPNTAYKAFRYDGIGYIDFYYPGADYTDGLGISNTGLIVGQYRTVSDQYGYLYNGSTYTKIEVPGNFYAEAMGVNSAGMVVGVYRQFTAEGPIHGFFYNGTSYATIDFPGASSTMATRINDAGTVFGYYYAREPDGNSKEHGFIYNQGDFTSFEFDFPGALYSIPNGINSSGLIAGAAYYGTGYNSKGLVYDGTTYTTIDFPGGIDTSVWDINDAGKIVGLYRDRDGSMRGFMATPIAGPMPLSIISNTPAGGRTGVSVNNAISATFSKAMDSSSITSANFLMNDGEVAGTISYDATNNLALFTPSTSLAYSTTYTAKITTGVKDPAGNHLAADYSWSFTTDSPPWPTVTQTTPVNNATGVSINSTITIDFSKMMDPSTIVYPNFQVNGGFMSGSFWGPGRLVIFTPSSSLSYSTMYTVKLTTGVKDIDGNALPADYSWSFTTVSPPVASVAPTSKDFGSVTSGTSSASQTFAVSNSGGVNLLVNTITLTGQNASEFRKMNDYCSGVNLAPSFTCTVDLMFTPTSGGTKSATLSISSDDPTTPMLNIPLTGIGTYPIISDLPASYDFGFAPQGTGSAVETFTITNNGLAANLFISSVDITRADTDQFIKQSDNCSGNALAYLANCTIGVIFSPTSPGTKIANLSISSNDPTTPILNIALTGNNSVAKVGVFRNGQWFLDLNGNGDWDGCGIDSCYTSFGMAGDIPVVGNWDGDLNRKEKVGVFRNGQWLLDLNGNGAWDSCGVDRCYSSFGMAGDIPVTGDWTGSGTTKIGVFRNGQWFLDLNGNGAWDGCGVDACITSFGLPTDVPVTGDWTGSGTNKIGTFRNGEWFLDLNGNGVWDGCGVDGCYTFGMVGDVPVVGDWNGNGTQKIGVFRNGAWFLDFNGDRAWSGCGAPADPTRDTCFMSFGMTADNPVAGRPNP